MAERFNAAVLKTVDCNRSGGSNPSLSAKRFLILSFVSEGFLLLWTLLRLFLDHTEKFWRSNFL